MSYEVTFPGGVAVDVTHRGHTVRTDQPEPYGQDTAMAPFDLFFASIASCAGLYALRFCQKREIPTEGLAVRVENVRDPENKRVTRSKIDVTLPDGFPEKYRDAILRAVDQCAVKKAISEPPEFELALSERELAASAR